MIKSSKKILLIGSGNSGLIAKMFYNNLVLKQYIAVYVEGKKDQLILMDKMKNSDLIICVSFSFSHDWTRDFYKKECKKIVFTANKLVKKKPEENVIIFSPKKTNLIKYQQEGFSEVSFANKIIYKILDGL